MIEFVNVTKVYEGGVVALSNANIKIENGEFVFLVGSSGAGKTTVTKLIMREENVTEGEIYLYGEDITKISRKEIPYLRRKMGVVFQDFRLLEDRTVYENVEFAMQIVGMSRREIRRRVPNVLNQVGLNYKAKMFPRQLSGGEQQRVALARALVNNPSILIADEPTGNLNPKTAMEIMEILENINSMGTTIIMATHAKDIVDVMKKRVIEIEDGIVVRDEVGGAYHSEAVEV
ncbi:MAG TPA: cell division ATP-binding protein FtsE [Candidatus Avimonoglobus intestinipullorum]|uniref:Cell division ATP-binding protein FtsE n=1 Tax=Candidatus Avimonoglobus intestinipullorum TaxID=2840699 RepID=A0A9D1LTX5_9FIRM|nr:cell division ATP-binding protein FtsE [Candidatus Avimonoglobus intestinipullorum]